MRDQLLPGLLIGSVVLAICASEPGGLDGGLGFILGFLAYFAMLRGIRLAVRTEAQRYLKMMQRASTSKYEDLRH